MRAERPFTILHVDGERALRGGERQLLYLAAALRARGHDNVICCRAGSELEVEASHQGFETRPLPFLSDFDPVSAWGLARLARRRYRPVLHAHTARAAGVAALAGRLGGVKTVAHRRVDFQLRGTLSRRLKYDGAGRVVAISRAVARQLQEDGLPRERVVVVPSGLPADAEERCWAGQPNGGFSAVTERERRLARCALALELGLSAADRWVGNLAALVPHKDHDALVEAAAIVLRQRPGVVFLIGGRGPLETSLRARIEEAGLGERVVLAGHRRDPARFLAALDVFALSSWGEGMGSVLLEVAARGIPIAATAAGGIPEVVEHARSGLLSPPRRPELLAANLLRLLDDPPFARALAAAARDRLPRFGLTRMAESLEAVYASL